MDLLKKFISKSMLVCGLIGSASTLGCSVRENPLALHLQLITATMVTNLTNQSPTHTTNHPALQKHDKQTLKKILYNKELKQQCNQKRNQPKVNKPYKQRRGR